MNKLPVGKTITYAYSFTFSQLGTIIGLCWFPLVLIAVLQFLPYAFGGDPMAPPANLTEEGRMGLERFASSLLLMLLYAIMYVPVIRQALGLRQGGALFHFSLGPPEFRLFGALVLFVLVLMAMAVGIGLLGLVSAGVGCCRREKCGAGAGFGDPDFRGGAGIYLCGVAALAFVLVLSSGGRAREPDAWSAHAGEFLAHLCHSAGVMVPIYLLHLGIDGDRRTSLFAPLPPDTTAAQHAIVQRFALSVSICRNIGLNLILAPFSIGLALAPPLSAIAR